MKKLMIVATVGLTAATLFAGSGTRRRAAQAGAGNTEGPETTGKEAMLVIDQYPQLGRRATLNAPGLAGESTIGVAYTGKPRKWIVLESKYTTMAKCLEQLTFTWHVLLETKSMTTKNKEALAKLAPYSYFTTTVTYYNIPRGSHAASVCLHPSYLEQYGEPKAVGIVVTNEKGDVLGGDTVSEIKGIKSGTQFWDNEAIMGAKASNGEPMIERRQGLLDRSKTIWALVNPNDYELTLQ